MNNIHVSVNRMDRQDLTSDDLPWREPTQERGRKRFQMLLGAARSLIGERGSATFKMTDVAMRAGVPVGSLYQFFPTRSAILMKLYADEMEAVDAALQRGLDAAASLDDVIAGVAWLMKQTLREVQRQPALLTILSSPTVDPAIEQADLENTRKNAGRLADRLMDLAATNPDPKTVRATAFLICHLWTSVIRLCVRSPTKTEADLVLNQYVAMIRAHLHSSLVW